MSNRSMLSNKWTQKSCWQMCSCNKMASYSLDFSRSFLLENSQFLKSLKWVWDPWQTAEGVCEMGYLQRGDSVVVKCGHLFLCECISCLITDLKASVELQHVQELNTVTTTTQNDHYNRMTLLHYNDYNSSVSQHLIVSVPCVYLCLCLGLLSCFLSYYCKASLRLQKGAIVKKLTIIIICLINNWKILHFNKC